MRTRATGAWAEAAALGVLVLCCAAAWGGWWTPPAPAAEVISAKRATPDLRVPINRASAAMLTLLPGIGPKTAGKIVAARRRMGRIPNLDALESIEGLGPERIGRIAPYVRFD